MVISRWFVVAPVLAGLAITGSAVARMMPAETVRDTVYQTCQHNGVHFNKQGHANCGLHKGWSDEPTSEPGDEPTSEPATEPGEGDRGGHAARHGDKAGHGHGHGQGHGHQTHGPATRSGTSGHGHGGGNTHAHGGGHGHAGGRGHGNS